MIGVTLQQKFLDYANVLKSFIGSSYLTMPFAFYQSGIVLGVITLFLIGFLNDHCCVKIVKCKDIIIESLIQQLEKKQEIGLLPEPEAELLNSGVLKSRLEERITLGHIAKYAFGKKGQWLVMICLFISQFGFCTGYIVFVGTTLFEISKYFMPGQHNSSTYANISFPSDQNPNGANNPMLIYMLLVPVPLFMLFSLLRTVRNMAGISVLANLAIIMVYLSIVGILINRFTVASDFELYNFKSFPVLFGMLTSAFEGIGTVIPVETSMINNRENYPFYLHITLGIVVFILGSFGILGNLRYGSITPQIITQSLDPGVFLVIINSFLLFGISCTYPLQMFPVVEITEFLFFRKKSAEFQKDRAQILNNNGVNSSASDFEDVQSDILAELSVDEINESRENTQSRRMSGNTIYKTSREFPNYQSLWKTISLNSSETPLNVNDDIIPNTDSVYTKRQMRMIRALYGCTIEVPAWKRNCVRIMLVLLQLGVAILMRNNYAYLSALIGALGSSFLSYILPAVTEYLLTRSTEKRLYCKIFNWFIILFGILGSISSLIITILKIVQESK